ncbi:TPA: hypothetical protein ACT9LS_000980 [Legionella pneumophila]|nr:hypothetical protein [Legionella pneumophila]HAU0888886.1 hypothetical protein [Legionella pneumophila]HCD9491452.1 hypothetical protein [Legionella pneumophila]HCD9497292.1 hypothetical protein [Legionella pneumophila]HCD9517970.1 hypothetical protein [Legionella pneumophila]
MINLFRSVVAENKQHELFRQLAHSDNFIAARKLILNFLEQFKIKDGNFIRQFQLKQSFHHRLWELYLYSYINSNPGRKIINENISPDLHIKENNHEYFIEATTLNIPDDETIKVDDFYLLNKYKSALIKKMRKKYWELEEVKEKPLIIAIHDYTLNETLGNTPFHLIDWLYLNKIKDEKKYIDFFEQEESKHISGILISGQATIPKFNRMGILAGYGEKNIKGVRLIQKLYTRSKEGDLKYNKKQKREMKELDDPSYFEGWSEGLVFFHNPNSLNPILPPLLGDITHVIQSQSGEVTIHPTGDEIYWSETWFFKIVDEL